MLAIEDEGVWGSRRLGLFALDVGVGFMSGRSRKCTGSKNANADSIGHGIFLDLYLRVVEAAVIFLSATRSDHQKPMHGLVLPAALSDSGDAVLTDACLHSRRHGDLSQSYTRCELSKNRIPEAFDRLLLGRHVEEL